MKTCLHCGEEFEAYHCWACGNRLIISACLECHDEIKHGLIGPPPGVKRTPPTRLPCLDLRSNRNCLDD